MAYRGLQNKIAEGDAELERRLSNLSVEESKDMSNVVECPVCLEVCSAPSFVCARGHLLCGACYCNGIAKCPLCGDQNLRQSMKLGKFLEKCKSVSCAFEVFGCGMKYNALEMRNHEVVCSFRRLKCPVKQCIDLIPEEQLKNHALVKHSDKCAKLSAFVSVNTDKSDMSTIFFNGYPGSMITFQLKYNVDKDSITGTAKYLGDGRMPKDTSFKVTFERGTDNVAWQGKVQCGQDGGDADIFHCSLRTLKNFQVPNTQKLEAHVSLMRCVGDKNPPKCPHYNRGCFLICPDNNCSAVVPCRLCHDDKIKSHKLQRVGVREVKCINCGIKQSPRKNCIACQNVFGKYFCGVCNLFERNDTGLLFFHCNKCGICRKKANATTSYSHCDKCGICVPQSIISTHECRVNSAMGQCFVCFEEKFDSVTPITPLRCGHYVHEDCRQTMAQETLVCLECLD